MPNQNHRYSSAGRPNPDTTVEQIPEGWALSPGFKLGGRDGYEIVHKLAEGGVGDVFVARYLGHASSSGSGYHRELARGALVALKVLRAEHLEDDNICARFRREAETVAKIRSPHTVRILDVGDADELYGAPYFAMERLVGMDLQQVSDEGGPMDRERVMKLAWQVASALDSAHERGIVHRDLKPENLFLTEDGYGRDLIKVLDFGAAKLDETTAAGGFKATQTGDFLGTPMYMTPEQCLGRSHQVGPTADVWAFGLIVHRLLTGAEYWTAQALTRLVAEIAFEPMPPPSERGACFGDLYDDWFLICCARDPEHRFQSVGTAAHALALALRS